MVLLLVLARPGEGGGVVMVVVVKVTRRGPNTSEVSTKPQAGGRENDESLQLPEVGGGWGWRGGVTDTKRGRLTRQASWASR